MDKSKFPGMFWSPEGEARVFNAAHEVPEGWTDKHPDHIRTEREAEARKPKPPEPGLELTRDEIVAALNDGGFEFKKNAGAKALYELLTAKVKDYLTERAVQFDPALSTRELLVLAQATPAE